MFLPQFYRLSALRESVHMNFIILIEKKKDFQYWLTYIHVWRRVVTAVSHISF